MYGKKVWIYPDLEMPPAGDSLLKGHESLIILNTGKNDAEITITLYFEDRPPAENIKTIVKGERVKCLRTNVPADFGGKIIPPETQYALKLTSSVPVVCQYGRLDTRQENMAFYTVMGYACEED